MTISPFSNTSNPLLTSISMKTLTTITDRAEIRMAWPGWTSPTPAQSHITLLDFPALKTARWLYVQSLAPSVQTFNLPLLERVQTAWFLGGNLHTINAPKLSSVGGIRLMRLPSIITPPTFFASLKGLVQSIEIWNMNNLTSIEFPNIEVLSSLSVWENLNLKKLSFPSLTLVTELHDRGRGSIHINANNPAFHLSLPKLEKVTGSVSLAGLKGVDIPELQSIGENPSWSAPAGGLYVGAADDGWGFRCTNCRPVYLTSFSAPKLRNVVGRISFDSAPELSNISFPSLKGAGEIRTKNTLALESENGLEMPEFKHVGKLQIVGKEARCEGWEHLFCNGGVGGEYSCGREDAISSPEEARRWPNFPPGCEGKVFPVKNTFDRMGWMEWVSEKVWADCYAERTQYCVRGHTLRTGFLITVGLVVVVMVISFVFKSWLRKRLKRLVWSTYNCVRRSILFSLN
ncbi:hypothetical protein BKA61DRAFT_726839 [Leptodontidium sp. MPI-SDFR-AT-0119]|nr:hypothetical protein BKA61DRAFT_726839 [Leptodontidium sp. MPI-SDFR-AT-0119]